MRIVFLGTPEPAVPSLDAVLDAGHDVPLVVTRPDRPVGRSRTPMPPPVKRTAIARGIEVLQPTRVRDDAFRRALADRRPDVLVVVAYGRILPAHVLDAPPRGAVNVHFSLLPRYRGAAPVQWALARGEHVTGVTTMQVDPALDAGAILLQREVPIEAHEHAPALQSRLAAAGAELLVATLDGMRRGTIEPLAQDGSLVTNAPMIASSDGDLDAAWTASEVEGRVRGFDPWPGVWMRVRGRRIRITDARRDGQPARAPQGTLVVTGEDVFLECAAGTRLRLRTLQPEGRRAMDAAAAVRGRYLVPGDRVSCGESHAGTVAADPGSE